MMGGTNPQARLSFLVKLSNGQCSHAVNASTAQKYNAMGDHIEHI